MDISTIEKTLFWQTDQSQNFLMLCELHCKETPEFLWVTSKGYIKVWVPYWETRDRDKPMLW